MQRELDKFLGQLPKASDDAHAEGVLSALAAHIADTLGVATPSALSASTAPEDNAIRETFLDLGPESCSPDLLGIVWEQLMSEDQRRTHGAHFTPKALAEQVVGRTLDGRVSHLTPASVWDPAAGGGAFLLAAARAIEERFGTSRDEIVRSLYASDLDPLALRVCDASLELWSSVGARPIVCEGDTLLDLPEDWPTDFDLVVGNPPFLGQLTSDTARPAADVARLKERYGSLAGGYVDQAGLFVECGLNHLGDGGALGFVLPQSLLGSADAELVRASAQRQARLESLWIDEDGSFAAAVEVVALVLVADGQEANSVEVATGMSPPVLVAAPSPRSWAPLMAAAMGVPPVHLAQDLRTLESLATATAGFRQHFYGIAGAVVEADRSDDNARGDRGRLMTAGTIDPLADLWGTRSIKFAGVKWQTPVLLLDRIEQDDVRKWFGERLVPKLLLASQTAVLEVVVDPKGEMVPSVPVVSIEPEDPSLLWHLAAAITSPTVCALLLTHAAGTGLSASAIRVQAKAIGTIPLPEPSQAWDRGAAEAERAQAAWAARDAEGYSSALRNLAFAMGEAYGDDGRLVNWWLERLPRRKPADLEGGANGQQR